MGDILKTACVQLNAGPDIFENLKQAETFIREAASLGAHFIATPENTCRILVDMDRKHRESYEHSEHPALSMFSNMAQELQIYLLIGSLTSVRVGQGLANRSFLFSPQGEIIATYDKIHMFDVRLSNGDACRESDTHAPGHRAVVADMGNIKLGMTSCYDVRFPHLYRALAVRGAHILAVPAAFTAQTGRAHWEVLLRARAIENGAFVVAPAQCGTHDGGRQTWGHSLIISPWGEILAEGGEAPGVIMADIDIKAVDAARQAIPSLKHDRDYAF